MEQRFTRPLPPGLVTLHDYAKSVDRTWMFLHAHWKPRAGFPARVGTLPPPGRNSGGPPEDVFDEAELNAFRASQPDLWGRRGTRLILGHDPLKRVSLAGFAALAGLPVPEPAGCPPPGADGLWPLGELAAWHNGRSSAAGPRLAVTELGELALVTLGAFARIVGLDRKTITQYRGTPGFPEPVDGKLYRLGEMARWIAARPGRPPRPGQRRGTAAAEPAT